MELGFLASVLVLLLYREGAPGSLELRVRFTAWHKFPQQVIMTQSA